MEFLKMRGPKYRPPNTIVLIIGTPKMVPPILGNPHMEFLKTRCESTFAEGPYSPVVRSVAL